MDVKTNFPSNGGGGGGGGERNAANKNRYASKGRRIPPSLPQITEKHNLEALLNAQLKH